MKTLIIAAHPDDEVLLAGGYAARFGADHVIYGKGRGDALDQRFDTIPILEITQWAERAIAEHKPDLIITHHPADVNKDHRLIFEAVMVAARPTTHRGAIWAGEVPGSSDWWHERFTPNVFVELAWADLDAKCEAMRAYTEERRKFPHPREEVRIFERGTYWGGIAMCYAAEPFQLIREIV